ncbi:MAG: helix-turn-helix transcriptional regulator [Flavobacteriales bacterium]|nr:helix-turn-helix transcriptional regulator [Flavobacteriales bacterium]MDG1766067.1 helix-turn-helix transcriptional regulator [Flavobacteriales bacterium]
MADKCSPFFLGLYGKDYLSNFVSSVEFERIHIKNEEVGVSISRMESSYEERKGIPGHPHRHNFYTVLLVDKATGTHAIDFNEYILDQHQVFFVAPDQVRHVVEDQEPKGFVILFTDDFLMRNNIPVNFIDQLKLFHDFGQAPPLQLSEEEHRQLALYCEEMLGLFAGDLSLKAEAIGALLKLFLIRCNNVCSLSENIRPENDHSQAILLEFKQLINQKHKEWHATSHYARALNISPDYLNRIVKAKTDKTAKEHIQSRIIVAAKRLLHFTDFSSKEIGYELGFSEAANFSAFFKKCVGLSPSDFRQNH